MLQCQSWVLNIRALMKTNVSEELYRYKVTNAIRILEQTALMRIM